MDTVEADIKTIWPDWQIVECIGRGSSGTVYKAVRNDLNHASFSAIKVLQVPQDEFERSSFCKAEGLTVDQSNAHYAATVQSIASEISLMETVKGNTNVVNIDDYKIIHHEKENIWRVYIRMEYLTTLYEQADIHGIDENEIIRIGVDICRALEICAEMKILHRDIKPENIFINKFGSYKLGDFGVARQLSMDASGITSTGTPNFMAPELYTNRIDRVNFDDVKKVDIYSLGMVLYWLANGRRQPFLSTEKRLLTQQERHEAFQKRISGEPLPPPGNVSKELQDIILKACAFSPKDRYADATAFREALEGLGEKKPETERTIPARALLLFCGAVILTILAVILLPRFFRKEETGANTDISSAEQQFSEGKAEITGREDTDESTASVSGAEASNTMTGANHEELTWSLSEGVLLISGNGEMADYAYDNTPWHDVKDQITELRIEDGITAIGTYAFFECGNLLKVNIPSSTRRINSMAFGYCYSLPTLTIPEGVRYIAESIVYRNRSLTEINLPASLIAMGGSFAGECPVLRTITVASGSENYVVVDGVLFDAEMKELICHPAGLSDIQYEIPFGVKTIGTYAFDGNTNLIRVTIPDTVTAIDSCAFSDCSNLKSMIVPDSVRRLGIYAFCDCEKLESITLSDNITSIDQQAFSRCYRLEEIVLPANLEKIGNSVFLDSSNLTRVTIPSTVNSIADNAFEGCPAVTICCEPGSYAQVFAEKNGIPFTYDQYNEYGFTAINITRCLPIGTAGS